MTLFRRFLLIAALAGYLAGLGVSGASATAMAGNMALGGVGEMGDCQGCDPDGSDDPAAVCDGPCLTPMTATLAPEFALWAPISAQTSDTAPLSFASRTGPPDSSPPRSIILS